MGGGRGPVRRIVATVAVGVAMWIGLGVGAAHAWTVRRSCEFLSADQAHTIGVAAGRVLGAAWAVIPHAQERGERLQSNLDLTAGPDLAGAFVCVAFSEPASSAPLPVATPCPDPRKAMVDKLKK